MLILFVLKRHISEYYINLNSDEQNSIVTTKKKIFQVLNVVRNYSKFLIYFVDQQCVQMHLSFGRDNTLLLKDTF